MQNLILAIAGLGIALGGGIYLARLMYFKKRGVLVKAEVMEAKEVLKRRGIALFGNIMRVAKRVAYYKHTMKYEYGGKMYEEQDKAGYTQPLKVGSTHLIMCDPKDGKKFKFEADIDSHVRVAAALAVAGVVFAGRFFYAYIK